MDIRRFFGPVSGKPVVQKPALPGNAKSTVKKKNNSASSDENEKKKKSTKIKNSKKEEHHKGGGKKRKKHAVIESDSEEELEPVIKSKATTSKTAPPPKKDPVQYVSETDSDSDNFLSLKKDSKPKQNGTAKSTKSEPEHACAESKERVKSPSQGKPGLKSLPGPTTPKSAPPPPKQTPTSVLDFFGSGTIHRSDKKLVASTKRKTPTHDLDDLISDEEMARQLQMEEVRENHDYVACYLFQVKSHCFIYSPAQARKSSEEQPGLSTTPQKNRTGSVSASSSPLKTSQSSDVISPSPRNTPVTVCSKVAMMKKRDEEKKEGPTRKTSMRNKSSPIKEPKTSPTSDKITPKPEVTPDDAEKKKLHSSAYRNYLNREGPRALGSKDIPKGAENCLEGCVFVLTGVLESMERDDAKSLIERYGGKVTGNISKKTSYLVQGRDGGVSKQEKAESLGTKILDEDGLLELIRTKPGKKSKYEITAEAEVSARTSSPHTPSPSKTGQAKGHVTRTSGYGTPTGRGSGRITQKELDLPSSSASEPSPPSMKGESLLWVDKYRPRSLKAVIGQQGDQSCANKLLRWLQSWYQHHSGAGGSKPAAKFSRFGGKDDGSGHKAALLSGPPGVGKTTTAVLVCEELGYSFVEMNASCTRSKNSLKEVVAESLNNTSIEGFYKGTSQTVSSKHVLIMDEVDGMAGNEDRGGVQELIALIKNTKIPIICMCNDRNHPKIRSLANYCFDLRFQRPRLEQIKGAMMSIAYKEGLKIPPPALNEIILASNQDVRQVIHNLSMWSAKDKVMTYDRCKSDAANAHKDMKLGPFDVCRKVFISGEETARMSLIDKSDLFFHDYSLAPLFVQENYVHVRPAAARGDMKSHLVLLSKTADSICDGDLVDRRIRSGQNWSLLPTQAIYASVIPGELMRGYMSQFPVFPSWLGKNSSTSKHSRIIQELSSHMSLKTMGSRQAVNLDYLYYLRQILLHPLQKYGAEGTGQAVQLLDDYQLIKEDVDSIMEISSWGGQPDPYSKLDSKVKAAFTRAYNREAHMTPYALQAVKKGRRGGSEDDGEGVQTDAMIKVSRSRVATSLSFRVFLTSPVCLCSRRRANPLKSLKRRRRKTLARARAKEKEKARLKTDEEAEKCPAPINIRNSAGNLLTFVTPLRFSFPAF
uniref:Replication factor C subunit 1 n=1 Tax=Nothobranchius furzeri TaxID=105023 RepID=A0A8C6LCX8_NOTFU